MVSGSRPLNCVSARQVGQRRARARPLDRRRDGGDVLRRRAAAAPDDVQQAGSRRTRAGSPPSSAAARRTRQRRSATLRSGNTTRVSSATAARSARYGRICAAPRAQLMPTLNGRAWRIGDPERLDGLSRQRAAAVVGDRHRDHDRQPRAALLEHLLARDDRGLRVQRVEDRLDEQQRRSRRPSARGPDRCRPRAARRTSARGTPGCSRRARSTACGWSGRWRRRRNAACPASSPSMPRPPRARDGRLRRSARTTSASSP